ncbi:lysylphosphatidylglycerol synthase transmembrane domain-containing protein [Methanoculleus sp.]|uniref:lysylphosphatidylglycerol synthase transmembrane domain-containing protein n=1 Tax=Methanoculleus sp. TaxID=90427 RepID=UPI00262C0430|nr:lysylphosphatidylglycerol synthase transmembrane domain-containing protein [Methanoculleus sp.]MDI6866509.1 lysylphosphatidylglycerol synthase transmembrane domain-containing protein [Methanoculleus sp.]
MPSKRPIRLIGIIGIAVFVVILVNLDTRAILTALLSVNYCYLIAALLVNGLIVVIKAKKWKIIVDSIRSGFSLWQSVIGFLVGFSLSTLTPAKVGDAARFLYARNESCTTGMALSTVVIDRIIDLVLLFAFGIIAMIAFSIIRGVEILSGGLLLVLAGAIIFGIYTISRKNYMEKILRPFFSVFVPTRYRNQVSGYFNDFYSGLEQFLASPGKVIRCLVAGISSWLLAVVYAVLLGMSIGIDVGYYMFLVIPIISVVDLLPISISGIGTRDATLLYLFGIIGIAPETVVAFSILYLVFSYWFIALVGLLFWFLYPVPLEMLKEEATETQSDI